MARALQTDELCDVFEVLSEDEILASRNHRHVAHAELEQSLAPSGVVQYVYVFVIDAFARKKLFRPETAASPRLREEHELVRDSVHGDLEIGGGEKLGYYPLRSTVKAKRSRIARPRAGERHADAIMHAHFEERVSARMKLIGTPMSPYTRKARVVLAEKRIEYEFVVDAPYDAATNVTSFNPLGKVPVLVLDDATTIFDSRVIVEYLDNASPVTKLLPEDTRHRIQARRWESLADGCTDACVAIVMERRRPEAFQYGEWIARQHGKVERALDAMSDDLGNRNWCCGDFFNLSDVAVGCCLGFLELRLAELAWREKYPNLARLAEKLAQRPSFRDTVPPRS